jgi:hypothetical protein
MSREHEFFLISSTDNGFEDFERPKEAERIVSVADDLILYMNDSLKWIPCANPSKNMAPQEGLNLYNETLIDKKGAVVAQKIFEGWRTLFASGPQVISLTGNYASSAESPNEGFYEKLTFERSLLVEKLSSLIQMCEQVIDGNNLVILHKGI